MKAKIQAFIYKIADQLPGWKVYLLSGLVGGC